MEKIAQSLSKQIQKYFTFEKNIFFNYLMVKSAYKVLMNFKHLFILLTDGGGKNRKHHQKALKVEIDWVQYCKNTLSDFAKNEFQRRTLFKNKISTQPFAYNQTPIQLKGCETG